MIEDLGETGRPPRGPTESAWLTTVGALGAGVAIGAVTLWSVGPWSTPTPSASPLASAVARESGPPAPPRATAVPARIFPDALNASVRQPMTVDDVSFSFSVPADGWARFDDLYISKSITGSQGAEAMVFWARFPVGDSARACDWSGDRPMGVTAAEVAAGLATGSMPGTELVDAPTNVTVGGLAAIQVTIFVRDDRGCGPGLFYTWEGEENRLGPMWGGTLLGDTITIRIFEIDGRRFIIAAETHPEADAALVAEVQSIIDSIEFRPSELDLESGDYLIGRHSTTVDGTPLSFEVEFMGWEPYPGEADSGPMGGIHLSKSTRGSQGAEEVIFWASYPDGLDAHPCGFLQNAERSVSALGLATRVATAPGTELVSGPEEVTVGGRPAVAVVVTVGEALGCDPGFFYHWEPKQDGALWVETRVGTTIRVWVVELDGGLLFVGAETTAQAADREREILAIVASISFE